MVHTEAPSPYGESLASRIASSASATFMIGSVGPNVSSVMAAIEWSTSASTVGSKKRPPSRARPPVVIRAPASRACSTWRLTMSSCGGNVIAPTSTLAGPAGTPWRSARTRSLTASTKRS